jgi:isopentenyl diphosphate isomerase/L-lactate dehydrogenase-like FMN-dependent dehydrogenase
LARVSSAGRTPLASAAPGATSIEPINVWDFERLARERLEPGAHGYFAGGAWDEQTLAENLAAYGRWYLRPRVLVDVSRTSPATTVLGTPVSMPVLVAPVALQRLADPGGEPAMARAAAAAGTIMCLSTIGTATPAEVAASAPAAPRWFQVYCFRDRGITDALVEQAVEAGFTALALTVDAPRAGRRERDLRTGFVVPPHVTVPSVAAALGGVAAPTPAEIFELMDETLGWSDVEEMAARSPLPLLVKGIQTGEDADLACRHGAAGIVVSNHGGRQLDGVAASLEMLPEVVEAVAGRLEVLVDGGVRRGTDVLKALALGARAVLVGRPALWGLAVDGERGAHRVLELLHEEIELAMALLGVTAPEQVTREHVMRA